MILKTRTTADCYWNSFRSLSFVARYRSLVWIGRGPWPNLRSKNSIIFNS